MQLVLEENKKLNIYINEKCDNVKNIPKKLNRNIFQNENKNLVKLNETLSSNKTEIEFLKKQNIKNEICFSENKCLVLRFL